MTSSRDREAGPKVGGARPNARRHRDRSVHLTVGEARFDKVGLPTFHVYDPYYFAISLNWKRFVLLFIATELAINVTFASLYMLGPHAIANQTPSGFAGAFFFSLETLATVGYGEMYPGSIYGHLVSSLEILVGVGFTAIMTGLLFVRFSKPKAKVVYADKAVITKMNGQPTLMFRLGNARAETLHGAYVTLHVLTRSVTSEGIRHAHPVELVLLRSLLPVFAITWTLMHVIDETSPLYGFEADSEELAGLRLFLTLAARDPALGQEVSDFHTFPGTNIHFGMRYVDAVTTVGNVTVADFSVLSEIEPEIVSRATLGETVENDLSVD